ncbi:enoyl-CoA hydratase/isomerase family protein [Desulfobacula sp.]|uniref:enoyl-CoA hydratase/isomerase family protein n=1 Tax=Desulfobacula sp. TaxID=2593537 RepID=UPI002608ACD0|nr:enoyl-CoA hydratase/isomerase family protein [Desulfobacula sp.]
MPDVKKIGKTFITRKNKYAVITFNRPEKMNALTPELFNSIKEAVDDVKNDDNINAVVITGGGDHFSAGGDVKGDIDPLKHMTIDEFKAYFKPINQLYLSLYNLNKPTIAAINGYALGAGLELALVCDIRIAADNALLGEFFVRMGLVPETGMCLLPKIVGPGIAKMMCFTGKVYKAEQALEMKLVDQIVPAEDLLGTAEELAAKLAKGPASIRLMKEAINRLGSVSLEESIEPVLNYQFAATRTEDHKEAVTAFLEKRKPVFKGL